MGKIRKPQKGLLFTAITYSSADGLSRAKSILEKDHGTISLESPEFIFDEYSSYYSKEMGTGLKKMLVAFPKIIAPDYLPVVKRYTNYIEYLISKEMGTYPARSVNIDPGYLLFSKIILASTKDYPQRIYLWGGIYAEVTLYYFKKSYQAATEFTYPDYKSDLVINFLNEARKLYKEMF